MVSIYGQKVSLPRIAGTADAVRWFFQTGIFSRKEIVPADRERYMKFCDLDTLEERLQNGFIQGYFRLESSGEWRSVKISRIPSDKERSYLYTIRKLQDGEKTIIDTFAEEHPEKL